MNATSATFHIKNFDSLQHYKDRAPPWIKLYNGLLDDYEFAALPDASKAHLLAIGLLASRYSNKIPLDAEWVGKRINATEPVNFDALIKSGFIVPDQPCSNLLADCKQTAIPERERETEKEREREKKGSTAVREKRTTQRHKLPDEFPTPELLTNSKQFWRTVSRFDLAEDAENQAVAFRDYHSSRGTTMANWDAAWRTWSRNALKFGGTGNGRGMGTANGSRRATSHDRFIAGAAQYVADLENGSASGSNDEGEKGDVTLPARLALLPS